MSVRQLINGYYCLAGTESLAAGGPASFQGAADFYTKEEIAAFAKPKKRVKKKLRKKAAGVCPSLPIDTACASEGPSTSPRARGVKNCARDQLQAASSV